MEESIYALLPRQEGVLSKPSMHRSQVRVVVVGREPGRCCAVAAAPEHVALRWVVRFASLPDC